MPTAQGSAKPSSRMTDEHKAALAAGRNDGRIVKAYLEALQASAGRKGRKKTAESIHERLGAIDDQLKSASALARLHLVQERRDLLGELKIIEQGADVELDELRSRFVLVAKRYSDRKGLSYESWREVGVDKATLRDAGISL